MLDDVDAIIKVLGPWGALGLGGASLVEYVFPPFPGDTVTLLGGVFVARGDSSLVLVYLALTLGSALGIAATWRFGLAVGGRLNELTPGTRVLGVSVEELHRAQAVMKTKGTWLLLVNRFLPSFRSVLFIAAGASGVPLPRALGLGLVSATLFNAVLLAAGMVIGENAEAIADFFRTWRTVSVGVLLAVMGVMVGRFLWNRARARSRP